MRRNTKFGNVFKETDTVQPFLPKFFTFAFSEDMICVCIPPHRRGAYASSRYVEAGSGGRDCCARRARAHGREIVWSWPPGAEAKSAVRRARRRRGQQSRFPRRSRISVQTIAQGMPDDLADPVVTAASFLCCWRAMGCGQHPAFPAPSDLPEEGSSAQLGRDRAARLRAHDGVVPGAIETCGPASAR
jgi:hypothetical protein